MRPMTSQGCTQRPPMPCTWFIAGFAEYYSTADVDG